MKTFYVDVYFLINFSVDIISVFFALRLTGAYVKTRRVICAALLGSAFACVVVLLGIEGMGFAVALLLTSLGVAFVSCKASLLMRFKVLVAFMVFETAIGGAVGALFSVMDKYLSPYFDMELSGTENRSLLLLGIVILIIYLLIRLILMIFEGRCSEKSVNIVGYLDRRAFEILALVDSGNKLRDPISNAPVIIVKKDSVGGIARAIEDALRDENYDIKRRLRVINSESLGGSRILMGIRLDKIEINNVEIKNGIIAIDESGGTFGGYDALVPATILGGDKQ